MDIRLAPTYLERPLSTIERTVRLARLGREAAACSGDGPRWGSDSGIRKLALAPNVQVTVLAAVVRAGDEVGAACWLAGWCGSGGHTLAFLTMGSVALAEELLLLAYDDESGRATGSHIGLDLGMSAAVLVELALAGRIVYVDRTIVVSDASPTGVPIVDEVLARLAADSPHTPASWLQRLRYGLRDRVLADLCARGVVRDVDETTLGVIHLHRYPTVDTTIEADIRGRLNRALSTDEVPDVRTAALATLVAATRMTPALGLAGSDLAAAHQRLEKISDDAGFSGAVNAELSTVRPSVALVVAVLVKAIQTALGSPRQ